MHAHGASKIVIACNSALDRDILPHIFYCLPFSKLFRDSSIFTYGNALEV